MSMDRYKSRKNVVGEFQIICIHCVVAVCQVIVAKVIHVSKCKNLQITHYERTFKLNYFGFAFAALVAKTATLFSQLYFAYFRLC